MRKGGGATTGGATTGAGRISPVGSVNGGVTSPVPGMGNSQSMSRGNSRGGTSASNRTGTRDGGGEDYGGDVIDPVAYIKSIEAGRQRSERIRRKDQELEDKLNSLIPVSERFGSNREQQILRKWEQRKTSWSNFKEKIAVKLNRDVDQLVISKADEYREQMEEYQVIQSAIPPHERYGANYWEMSLHGIGSRTIPIGNIFSGLFCPIKETQPPPKMVRRPKKVGEGKTATGELDKDGKPLLKRVATWRDSKVLNRRKEELQKSLSMLRPHEIREEDVGGLHVKCEDLFDWAIRSSEEYFEQQQQVEDQEDDEKYFGKAAETENEADNAADVLPVAPTGPVGPHVAIDKSELLFETPKDTTKTMTMQLANTGTTVIFYSVIPISEESNPFHQQMLRNRPRNVDTITADSPAFFCHDQSIDRRLSAQ